MRGRATRLAVLLASGALTMGLAGPAQAMISLVPASATVSEGAVVEHGDIEIAIEEVDLDGPSIENVTVTVTNASRRSLSRLRVTFRGPTGWATNPDTLSYKGTLRPGRSARLTFQVQVPSLRPGFRIYDFTALATYSGGDGAGSSEYTSSQHSGEIMSDLSQAYNNVGVTDESATREGNFDGEGNSFSAQKLADVGLTPGARVDALGASFTWPTAAAGTKNNVASAGQAVDLQGSGSRIAVLCSGSGQSASGLMSVHYTDGTSSKESLGVPNWSFQDATDFGASLVAASKGRNRPNGYGDAAYDYRVFANSIPVDPTKRIDFVVLPSNGAIHLFDMEVVT